MDTTHNAENERIKREYLWFLKHARGQSEASIDAIAKSIHRFETHTGFANFKTYTPKQAVDFKVHLTETLAQRSGEPLSKATLHSTTNALKTFFQWLAGRTGYKRLTYSDADYFRLSAKDVRIATAHREREGPTLEQIAMVVESMPASSETERRDRAIVAFTILTGARVAAVASLKLKHIDLINNAILQDAREVKTKNSKTINTWFFPVDDIYRTIVAEWVQYLRTQRGWGDEDPLFPRTKVAPNADGEFAAAGLEREHWSSTSRIRSIFEDAFERAGLPYYHPHSFRKTLVSHAERLCRTPEQLKAWSQNLGHESVTTTLRSYGAVSCHRQAEIMRALSSSENNEEVEKEIFRQMAELVYRLKAPTR